MRDQREPRTLYPDCQGLQNFGLPRSSPVFARKSGSRNGYLLLYYHYIIVCLDIEDSLFDRTQMLLRRLYLSILLFICQVRERHERHTYIGEIEVNGFLKNLLMHLPFRQIPIICLPIWFQNSRPKQLRASQQHYPPPAPQHHPSPAANQTQRVYGCS